MSSLRQRGQRPSESTNEGGGGGGVYNSSPSSSAISGYGASPPSAAAASGGGVTTTNPYGGGGGGGGYYGASSPSSSGSGYNTSPSSSVSAAIGGGGGGANNNYAAKTTPQPSSSSGYPSASSAAGYAYGGGGGGAYNNYHQAAAVASPYAASAGYPNNAAGAAAATPAYNAYGGGGYNTQAGAGSGYGGYSGSPTTNPFQKTTKSSSSSSSFFNLGSITSNILPLFLGLTICTLTATTFHFRHSMQQIHSQIELSKQTMEKHHQRTKQTLQSNRDQMEQEKISLIENNHRIEEQIKKLTTKHDDLAHHHSNSIDALNQLETEKQSVLKKIDHTKYALEDVAYELEKYTSMLEGKAEVEVYSKKREKALWNVVERLETKIGRESWREAEEWFGPGPHQVEIELEYPKVNTADPPSKWPRIRNKIVIEMAPLDLMPHSVNLFLQQVHHGLWDGNELTTNPDHIMSFGYHRASAHEGFVDRALETVSYQEYSHKYPHVQWTVGFMGRPSGPDFYINKLDNTVAHGPGGQANSEDMHNEADPCFGRVVEGFDVLNEINAVPVDKEHRHELSYPVMIISARVMAQRNSNSFGNQGGGGGDRGGAWQGVQHGRKFDEGDEIMPLPTDEIPRAP